jgi:Protein of unknown function (DUF3987)
MSPVERLLGSLPDAKRAGKGWLARCPAHEDRRASLSINEGDDGRALLHCHAGCEVEAICAAVGLKPADLFVPSTSTVFQPTPAKRENSRRHNGKPARQTFPTACEAVVELERKRGESVASWTYHDPRGEPLGVVIRWDIPATRNAPAEKDILPVSRFSDGWRIAGMPEPRPLYRLPDLADVNRIYVCEGEKAADAARSIGLTATTSPHGADSSAKADWAALAGKEVVIVPDNDAAGRKYADAVTNILAKLTPAPVVKLLELPNLPDGGDIVDWIEAHGDAAEPAELRRQLETLADDIEPIKSVSLSPDVERFKPFPVEALPEPVRGFVAAAAKAIGCDSSYVALPLLASLASAIGNTRRLQLKRGWAVPAIIWAAIVGDSGTAKTPAFKLVMRPIRERQRRALERHDEEIRQYDADLIRWEKTMNEWKRSKNAGDPPEKPEAPQADRCVVSDTTVEALAPLLKANPRGLLLARDELAGWIGSFDRYAAGKSGADASHWLSMHNGESIVVDRKSGTPRTIFVSQASVSVCAGIQPGNLHRALGTEHRESGLAARLLLACPPRKAKCWTEAEIDPADESQIANLLERLYELQFAGDDEVSRPVTIELTAAAKTAWKAYFNAHAQEQVDLTAELSAAWSKLEEYAARLALVLHFIRWAANDPLLESADLVDVDSMSAGVTLATWFKGEAKRVYSILDESDDRRIQRWLIEWIERKGSSVTAREVQQGCRWLKEPGTAEAALEELVKAEQGLWEPSPAGQRGQPTRRFCLSTVYSIKSRAEADGKTVDVDGLDGGIDQPADEQRLS